MSDDTQHKPEEGAPEPQEKKGQLNEIVEKEAVAAKTVEESDANLIAVPCDSIPLNLPLPCSVYIRVADKFPVFRKQGDKLDSKRMIALSQKGASSLFIHKAVWNLFLASLDHTSISKDAPREVVASQLRGIIIAYATELERKIKQPKRPIFDKLEALSESLAASIKKDPAISTYLLRKSNEPLDYFVNHAVNCAVYSTVIASKLNFSWNDLKEVTYCALLHDLGELFHPKTLLYKRSDLTKEEREEMQLHPRRGAEVLQTMGCSPAVVLTALQHHERMDGKGYPQGIELKDVHINARIVAIADTYDALTSHKPYQAAISPQAAIEKMKTLAGKFDPNILGVVTGTATEGESFSKGVAENSQNYAGSAESPAPAPAPTEAEGTKKTAA